MLSDLLDALRDFIVTRDIGGIEASINRIRVQLDYDIANLNHIHLALYMLQDAVSCRPISDLIVSASANHH